MMKINKMKMRVTIRLVFVLLLSYYFSVIDVFAQTSVTGIISFSETISLAEGQTEFNHTWPNNYAFSNDQYFLYIRAWHEETLADEKVIQVENAIYDFSKSETGFSLKLKKSGGKLTYYAVEAAQTQNTNVTPYIQSFVATQGQTRFTLDNTPSEAWVWLNGLLQFPGDWTTEDSDIVLSTPTSAGDEVGVYYKEGGNSGNDTVSTNNYTLTVTEKYLHDANTTNSGYVQNESKQYEEGTSVLLTTDFPNDGDNFQGYTLNIDGSNPSPTLNITINENTEVYAVYDYTNPTASTLLDGLVSCWELNETSGTIIVDSLGINNGTINNGVVVGQPGIIEKACSFDGINDYINFGYDVSLTPVNFSISLWVNPDTYTGSLEGVLVGAGGTGWTHGYRFSRYETKVDFHWGTGTSSSQTLSLGYLSVDSWSHLMAVYDGTKVSVYFNGEFVVSGTNAFGYDPTNPEWDAFFIGRGGGLNNFHGKVDQIGFWNRALTEQEIQELYNSGNGNAYPFNQ